MIRAYRLMFVIIATILATSAASAQVTTGTPPFGSFGGGPDVIDLANLNSHIVIPVRHKAGRGTDFTYDLSYDSSVWYPVGASGSQTWQPVTNWGWRGQTEIAIGYITYSTSTTNCTLDVFPRQYGLVQHYFGWVYHDSFGVPHSFVLNVYSNECTGAFTSGTATATDGSGYTMTADATPSATVFSSSGKVLNAPLLSASGTGKTTDRNGNQISVSTGGVFTDTLGTTALTVTGGAPNPLNFTYTAPSGAAASVKMNYTSYTAKTFFGISGIAEYGPTSVSLVSSVVLPDGSQYTFTYEPTPSGAACTPLSGTTQCVTARLASVTLSTGGSISYSYSGGNNGLFSDGSTATLTRTTPDGAWTYARTQGTAPASTTLVTDPQSNQTQIQFQGIYETQRMAYQGSTAGTLLQTVNTCYNGSALPCTGTAITLPITRRTQIVQLPNSAGKQAEYDAYYNAYGLQTEEDDYDYGSGAVGSLLKKTLVTYASLGNGIVDKPASVTVQDGAGTTKAQTTFAYDQTTLVATSGTPSQVAVTGSRGNATTVTNLVQGTAFLTKTITYFDTGNVQTVTDINGAQTTYNYASAAASCGNSFPTGVTLPLNLSKSVTWNCTGGVTTQITDENGQNTTPSYTDAYFWRPASVTDPTSAVTNFSYPSSPSFNTTESSLSFNAGSSIVDVLATLDGLGRNHVQQKRQSPGSSNFDSVETDYDSLGRPNRVTPPYSATSAGQTNPSPAPATTITYDALGRVLTKTDAGTGTASYSYTQNDVLVTLGPAPTGENPKRRQMEYDALGRLTSVCEITIATGSGTCGQTSAQVGFWTKYTYDVLGNLTSVTQNAQAAAGSQQTRSYSYDGLSRLTSETNPESGPVSYFYDVVPTGCAAAGTLYSGDLTKRVDAGGSTCYFYDTLHRLTDVGFPTGCKRYRYDSATVNGVAMANAKGRLVEIFTDDCSAWPVTTKITDVGFSYSARGEVTDIYQSTLHSGGFYHLSESYWANGTPNQLSGLPGLPAITYGVDGGGRPSTVSASTGQNPVTGTAYNVFGMPTQVSFGSGDSDSFGYDPNTGRMSQYQFNVNGQLDAGALTWNANGTLQQLAISNAFNAADNQICTYGHDDLTRLASANCGAVWSQTFGYDAFGNLTKSGSMSFQPAYSTSTNRMTSLPGFTPTYDANGNVLNDSFHSYTWDGNGHPLTIDSVSLTYDALGRMMEQNRSGVYTQIVYAPTGEKLALMNGQTLQKAFMPLPGGAGAVYTSSGLSYYRHSDWLGSSRLASTPARTVYSATAYAPFGEPYAQSGAADPSFTGQNQDTVGGSYDFLFREYATQGRWPSPDPLGGDIGNPQSLNRYAYVMNNPLALFDPFGLASCKKDDTCDDKFGRYDHFSDAVGSSGCYVNYIATSCGMAFSLLSMGSGPGNGTGAGSWQYGCVLGPSRGDYPRETVCGFYWIPGLGAGGGNTSGPANNRQNPQPQPPKQCYGGNSRTDKAVRIFSLLRLPETWKEWVVGGAAKISIFGVAKAGAKSAGGAESLGSAAIGTGGKILGLAGSAATIAATMVDIDCHIGPVEPYTEK